jgi:DNA-binding MarR family transcriptional regulator
MFNELNPLLHQQLRLSVISLLMNVKEADFTYIREKTGATAGNLSVQINKLAEAEYLQVKKSFKENYPLTTCSVTSKGRKAFEEYVISLQEYLKPTK